MTLKLILTRHAKSDWGFPGLADFDRPLNDRGRRSAAALGEWLAAGGQRPDEAVVSGARRTVETWEGIAAAFAPPPPVRIARALYEAEPDAILEVLNRAEAPVTMLIGHNPGIGMFAERIAREPPAHPRFLDYPTGATTVLTFAAARWSDVGWGDGAVVAFAVPRDLLA